jgi:RHS repeat-associated protein
MKTTQTLCVTAVSTFDKETGTIYLRARYYDARIGRFISEDSVRGNANDPLS